MPIPVQPSCSAPRTEFAGVGVSATLEGAAKLCRWRRDRHQPAWSRLGYLQLGLYSHDELPEALPALLEAVQLPTVVHLLELNLVRPLDDQQALLDTLVAKVEAIGPRYVEEDLGLWRWGTTELEQHMLPPIFDEDTAHTIARNIEQVQARLEVPFYVENPPIYFDLGTLDVLSFMQSVAEQAGCGLVLDIGHLVGYCVATGREPDEMLEAWSGIEHVREIHVAGYNLLPDFASAPMWYDNHADPVTEPALELIEIARERAGWAIPITLEQEGATYGLIARHIDRVSERFAS